MPSRINPKEKTERLSPDSDRRQFIKELAEKVRRDDDARQVWKNKLVVANNQRLGVRKKTNRPYPGGVEVPLPTTDKLIKKLKSLYVSIGTQMRKQIIVTLEPGVVQPANARESAEKIEKALNGLIRKRDFQWTKKLTLFVDYFLEGGHALFKIIEKFFSRTISRTLDISELDEESIKEIKRLRKEEALQILALRENMSLDNEEDRKELDKAYKQFKSGKKELKFKKKIVYSEPTAEPERGIRVIVPKGTTDLQRATRITHDLWMTLDELKEKAKSGIYDMSVIEKLKEDGGMDDESLAAVAWAASEGVDKDSVKSELFNVRECQTKYNGEKWVFSWIEFGSKETKSERDFGDVKVIQELRFPYEHGLWTWVKHDLELKNTRWHSSRGVPEQIRGLHQIMEKLYNARLIRDEMNNAPMIRVSPALGYSGSEIKFKPGQAIEAEQGQVEYLNRINSTDISSERIEQQAKAYIEEYMAVPDFTLNSAVNPGKSRTLGEINTAQSQSQRQIGIDISLFTESLSEVAQQMYLILKESITGPRVIGGTILHPDDFLTRVNVAWAGSLEATDKQLQEVKAVQRIQMLAQIGMPIGIVTQEDMYNAMFDWLDKDPDIEDPNRYLTDPKTVQQSEVEDQMKEITMMITGFEPSVKPDDQHAVHLEVISQYMESRNGKAALQDREFAQRLERHANFHIQAEQAKGQLNDQAESRTAEIQGNRALRKDTNGTAQRRTQIARVQ